MNWLDMNNLSFNILVMLQRGQGMSSPKRNPFYFMLMVRKVSVVDKEAVGEEVAAINFKFLLFKGLQIFNQTKQPVQVNFSTDADDKGKVALPKVELSFFIRDFKHDQNNDFIFIIKTVGEDGTEKELGNHTIFSSDIIDTCTSDGSNKKYESVLLSGFKFEFLIFVDSNRFELEKIIKAYKQSDPLSQEELQSPKAKKQSEKAAEKIKQYTYKSPPKSNDKQSPAGRRNYQNTPSPPKPSPEFKSKPNSPHPKHEDHKKAAEPQVADPPVTIDAEQKPLVQIMSEEKHSPQHEEKPRDETQNISQPQQQVETVKVQENHEASEPPIIQPPCVLPIDIEMRDKETKSKQESGIQQAEPHNEALVEDGSSKPTGQQSPALQDSEPALQDSEPALQDSEPALQDSEPTLQDNQPALQDNQPEQITENIHQTVNESHQPEQIPGYHEDPEPIGKEEARIDEYIQDKPIQNQQASHNQGIAEDDLKKEEGQQILEAIEHPPMAEEAEQTLQKEEIKGQQNIAEDAQGWRHKQIQQQEKPILQQQANQPNMPILEVQQPHSKPHQAEELEPEPLIDEGHPVPPHEPTLAQQPNQEEHPNQEEQPHPHQLEPQDQPETTKPEQTGKGQKSLLQRLLPEDFGNSPEGRFVPPESKRSDEEIMHSPELSGHAKVIDSLKRSDLSNQSQIKKEITQKKNAHSSMSIKAFLFMVVSFMLILFVMQPSRKAPPKKTTSFLSFI